MEIVLVIVGFLLASYSIIANDAIQTLGTFLASNSKRPWWVLWAFASSILTAVLLYGWWAHNGDVSYGRLSRIPIAETLQWWHVMPPLILLILTRFGIPVSTTFLVLSVFTPGVLLGKIVIKSLVGYGVAFASAIFLWALISKIIERKFIDQPIKPRSNWVWVQWLTTGFLWTQWLIQDLANIFVFLPRQIELPQLLLALAAMLSILAFVFRSKGGKIQEIVRSKANTHDIRSATFIDGLYAVVLLFFKEINNLPMSTTWVFLGVLAGRQYAISHQLRLFPLRETFKMTAMDFSKAAAGLLISIGVALSIQEVLSNKKPEISKSEQAVETVLVERPTPLSETLSHKKK